MGRNDNPIGMVQLIGVVTDLRPVRVSGHRADRGGGVDRGQALGRRLFNVCSVWEGLSEPRRSLKKTALIRVNRCDLWAVFRA